MDKEFFCYGCWKWRTGVKHRIGKHNYCDPCNTRYHQIKTRPGQHAARLRHTTKAYRAGKFHVPE